MGEGGVEEEARVEGVGGEEIRVGLPHRDASVLKY